MSKMRNQIRKKKTNTGLGKTGVLKRGLALLLAVLMTESVTVNAGISYVKAQEVSALQAEAESLKAAESESGAESVLQGYRILGFGELPEEIQVQNLPVGAKEADIEFPDELTVTAKELLTSNTKDGKEEDNSQQDAEKTEPSVEDTEKEDSGKEDVNKEDVNKEDAEEDSEKEASKEENSQEEDSKEEGTSGENTEKETGEKEDASEGELAGEESAREEQEKGQETGTTEAIGTENKNSESGSPEQGQKEEVKEEPGTENTGETIITQAAAMWEQFEDAFRPMTVYAAEPEGSDPMNGEEDQSDKPEQSEGKESTETEEEQTTGGETVELTLTGIEWKLDPAESDFPVFDGKQNGAAYTYTPVLPEVSDDGTPIILDENAELPVICVLVGELQVSLLSNGGVYKLDDLPVNKVNGSYEFVIDSGNRDTYNGAVLTGGFSDFQDNGTTIGSSWKGIVIDGGEVNLTIRDVTIDRYLSSDNKWESTDAAITLRNGASLNLTLEGDNYLEGATGGAGICVGENCTLRITKESTGKLKAVGGNYYGGAAGIGANGTGWTLGGTTDVKQKLGHIVIEGGTIEAVGGTHPYGEGVASAAAAIGGSCGGTTGSIEISGGNITAIGGTAAAAIGGGIAGWVSSITISGGTITATASERDNKRLGAAIGAGSYALTSGDYSCGTIKITGGTIIANGNIGYGEGWKQGAGNKEGSVEIGSDVDLTLIDGRIDPDAGEEFTEYTFSFTIYDGRLVKKTVADISMDGTVVANNATATVKPTGTAVITAKFLSRVLSGRKKFVITINENSYETDIDFTDGRISYQKSIGTELYPVTLEFYDPAITQDLDVSEVIIKQKGSVLEAGKYYSPVKISKKAQNYGTMELYLPEGNANTEVSVTVSDLNQGKPVIQSGKSISATGKNTIVMLQPHPISLAVDLLSVENGKAGLKVTSNYAGTTLWYLESNGDSEPNLEEIRKGTQINIKETSQEITVSCDNVSEHHFYLFAELGGTASEVKEIRFSSTPSVELIKKGDTKGILYDSFSEAVEEAEKNSESTIKLLKDIKLSISADDKDNIESMKGTYTIDLNGKTITADYSAGTGSLIRISSGASVTLVDNSSGGKFTGNDLNDEKNILFNVSGRLIIKGGIFEEQAGSISSEMGSSGVWIEAGTFKNNIIYKGQGTTGVLSGGTFEGTITANWGTAKILKRGYRYKLLSNGSVSAGDTDETISKVEVVPLPPIEGTVTLDSKGAISWGTTLTATYAPVSGQSDEKYLYSWYCEDENGNVERIVRSLEKEKATEELTDSFLIPSKYVGKWIYCQVEAEGTSYSGSICSEKVMVLGKDIRTITHGGITKNYNGKPVTLTQEDFDAKYVRCEYSGAVLKLGIDVEIDENSYQNNIEPSTADSKASVTLRGIGLYRGEYVLPFTIAEKDIAAVATVSSNDWTNKPVTVSAPEGYTICRKTENGYDYENGFGKSLTVTEESASSDGTTIFYRLKEDTDEAISAEKQITVKIDRGAPNFEGEEGGIKVENNIWKQLLNKITFGTYIRTKDVTIKASDTVSEVAEYYYYVDTVTDKENYQILSKETLDSYVREDKFNQNDAGKFSLFDAENQVVYAYAVDHAGNRSDYICTEGLVLDTKAPVMTIKQPTLEDGTLKDTEATITVELEEDAAILFFYERKSFFENEDKYKQYVTAVNDYMINSDPQYPQFLENENGKWVPTVSENDLEYGSERFKYRWKSIQLVKDDKLDLIQRAQRVVYRIEGKAGKNSIIIEEYPIGLDPDTNYTIWIAAVDSAGNITERHFEFQTTKIMPRIETLPVVSGVYGDTAQDLKVTQDGVARYGDEEIGGSWNITDTGTALLPMDGTAKCQVTFTPDERYDEKYESVVFEVTPTLEKRPVEVVILSISKAYGSEMPLLYDYAKIYQTTENKLVTPVEDAQSIKESLRWVTEATKDSPVGQYEYTVTSDSSKYEVTAVYYDVSTGTYDKSKGILTITKAPGKLEKTADFNELQAVQYQGGNQGAFQLGVQANHNETPLHYEVTDAKDGNGNSIESENISSQLLTIAADGTVTPKGVGSATITVSLPECNNYTAAAEPMTVRVNIKKGDVAPSQVETAGALTYGEPLSRLGFAKAVFVDAGDNSVTIPGTIEWKDPDTIPAAGTYEAEYRFKPYAESDPSWENNYNTYEGKVTVTVNKAKAKLVNVPVPGDKIYNPNLSLSVWLLNESAKEPGHVEDIEGNWIQGSWKFTDPDVVYTALQEIGVGTKSYEIYFEPNLNQAYGGNPDYANYDFSDIKATVNITVKKAVPYIDVQPTVNPYTHGDYLYNQNLSEGTVIIGNGKGESGSGSSETKTQIPGTFTWKTPSTQLSHTESNGKEYEYVFTPDDTASYETVTGKITIAVNKAEYPPLMPGHSMDVAHSCTKVSDVGLPQGWEWQEAYRETTLEVGRPVKAMAVYQAADAQNYNNTSVSIQITRSRCDHAKTEVRNPVKATCIKEGNTGEIWCLICNEKVSDGDEIPKDASNHVALTETVIRQATTSAEGLILRECKPCGYREEVTIPKLPGGNSGGSTGGKDDQQSGGQSDGQNENQGPDSSSSASSAGSTATPTPAAGGKAQSPTPAPSPAPASKPASTPVPSDNNRETKEPFIKGENGKEGWQVIESQTDGAKEGETIHVDMNGATTVPGTIFDSIRGRDITVTFDLGGGILWTVNGLDVTAQNVKDIDFGVTMGEQAGSSIPVDVINNVTGERYSMNLTLAYDGEFGFTATLTVNMDAANAGLYANLFYYNPETGELEFMCAGKIDEAGNTELTFSHASDYTIVIDTIPMDGSVQDETGAETETEQDGTLDDPNDTGAAPSGQTADEAADGDSGNVFSNGIFWILIGAAIVIVIAAVGAVCVLRRKKEDQRMEEQK